MTKTTLSLITLIVICFTVSARADRPARERPYAIVSPDGQYVFTMVPSAILQGKHSPPQGEALRLEADGTLTSYWKVDGWYAFDTYLSRDGRFLIRMGPWASAPPEEELAVAFYDRGKEIRTYTVADILEDIESVERSVSHYTWQADDPRFPRLVEDQHFQLLSIERRLITFDITNGAVLSRQRFNN